MKYKLGNKKEFLKFLNSITKKDRIGVLSHNDADGIISGVILTQILKKRGFNIKHIDFLKIMSNMLQKQVSLMKKKKITKIFILDLGVDDIDEKGFRILRNHFDVFLIDHHPVSPLLKNKKNIIKADSGDCVAFVLYDLDKENLKKWLLIVCSAMIADMSVKEKLSNLRFVQRIYTGLKKDDYFNSTPGMLAKKINSSIIYYRSKNNLKKIYEFILNKKIKKLEESHQRVNKDIQNYTKNFEKNSVSFPDKSLYFYFIDSKFSIISTISTILSLKNQSKIFFIYSSDGKFYNISARSQKFDVESLVKKSIKNLKYASGGGHKRAAGVMLLVEVIKELLV
jgi:single-stranded DNA-specific DHH superfamily exonuclease